MKINIKFFAMGEDLIGQRTLDWNLQEAANLQTLIDQIKTQYPNFRELKTFLVAVNQEYSDMNTILNDGDEIAIIPPVSGG